MSQVCTSSAKTSLVFSWTDEYKDAQVVNVLVVTVGVPIEVQIGDRNDESINYDTRIGRFESNESGPSRSCV